MHKTKLWRHFARTIAGPALVLSLILTACSPVRQVKQAENQEFAQFADELFTSLVSSDSLTLNYTLASPEKYGIQKLPQGFSSFSYEDMCAETSVYENLLASLEQYDKNSLSFEQQILYDCLREKLELDIQQGNYTAFTESLGPTTGIQAQLPVLLAEFCIGDRSDLEQYFSLLETVPAYFDSLLTLEEKKAELGTLPGRDTLQHIREQCQEFVSTEGVLMMSQSFENRVQSLSFLSAEEKKETLSRHELCITQKVLPAYQELIRGIESLIPRAGTEGSLSARPGGTAYYKHLLRSVTGSGLSMEEMEHIMEDALKKSSQTLLTYAAKDPSLFRSCQNYISRFSSAEQILKHLTGAISGDFPEIQGGSYEVKSVDESLENFLSPAFYLTPPIDAPDNHVIYINNADKFDPSSLFNTLAHEGYPGHLYQTSYMYEKKMPPLRYLLNYGGYTEGWATYAEILSYRYTGITEEEAAILQNNTTVSLCLYGLCDIGVHGHGWDENKINDLISPYGSWGSQAAERIYAAVTDEPASYLKYTVGYLEILRLKEQMRQLLADSFSEKLFHTFFLDMGPCSFPTLSDNMEKWCRQNGCIS